MKKSLVIATVAILCLQLGIWLICEMVGRSVALEVQSYRIAEPYFTGVVLGHRSILWLSASAWGIGTCLFWRRLSNNMELALAYFAGMGLFAVLLTITAVLACILPYLPRK
jgi:hypothetical protein